MLARSNTFSQQKIHADLLSKIFDIFLVKKLCFSFEKRDFCKYFAMRALRIHDVAIRMHSRTSTIEIRVFFVFIRARFQKKRLLPSNLRKQNTGKYFSSRFLLFYCEFLFFCDVLSCWNSNSFFCSRFASQSCLQC